MPERAFTAPPPLPIVEATGAVLRDVRVDYDFAGRGMEVTATLSNGHIWTDWSQDSIAVAQLNALIGERMSTITSSTASNIIWNAWNTSYDATGSSVTISGYASTWTAWQDQYILLDELRTSIPDYQRYARRNLSEEELRRELEREKKLREEAEKRAKAERDAKDRAERLLLANLSPQQREDLQKKGSFYLEIPLGNGSVERYRIDRGFQGNVKQIDARGSVIRSFCIHPDGVPAADAMLAQKLFIEADEETRAKFWETANITDLNPAKKIPAHIPRAQRRQYALQNGLLH